MEKYERKRTETGCRRSLNNMNKAIPYSLVACMCFFFICTGGFLDASEVDVEVSAQEIGTDESLIVTVSIRNEDPSNTALSVAAVPDSFSSVSTKKELVQIPLPGVTPAKTVSATVYTYEWVARTAGVHEVGPFRVTIGDSTIELPVVYITVRETKSSSPASLVWSVPAVIPESGKALRIRLSGSFSGEVVSLRCPPPENALLSRIYIQSQVDSSTDYRVLEEFDWTPLVEGTMQLPVAILEYRTFDGEILHASTRPRSVQVVRGKSFQSSRPAPVHVRSAFTGTSPVPDTTSFSDKEERNAEAVGILFHLRQSEYTSLFPGKARAERIQLEESLGLQNNPDVPLALWKIPLIAVALVLCAIALITGLLSSPGQKRRRFSAFCIMCSSLFAVSSVYLVIEDVTDRAVVTGCALLNVPEPGSTVIDSLPGGTVVSVIKTSGGWSCVETPSSIQGWVPSTSLLVYTRGSVF